MSWASEDQLLILCSRVSLGSDTISRALGLLRGNLDWKYLLMASIRHGVAPLFYHGLGQVIQSSRGVEVSIPAGVVETLEKLYRMSRARNRHLYQVVGEISTSFDEAGIQLMGLKDLHLARDIYPDAGLRPMGDIDLLIHFQDYEKVALCLGKLGFEPLPRPEIPYLLKYAWGHHFRRPADDVWVDLQWNVMQIEWDHVQEGNFDFEIERMWDGARQVAIDSFQIWVPGLEDMLFHLCLHLEGHRYEELILFCDIAELIKKYQQQIDWAYLVRIVKKYGVESSVYYPLFLIQQLFQVDLPVSLLADMRPAYLKAGMFPALYGNLTRLHYALDEIGAGIRPPAETMGAFEVVVRQQTACAMQLYRELDGLVGAFLKNGGQCIFPEGSPSKKVFPDALLDAFGEVRLLFLENDLGKLRQAFTSQGFEISNPGNGDVYVKKVNIVSNDPVLNGRSARFSLEIQETKHPDGLFQQEVSYSSSSIALKSLGVMLIGRSGDSSTLAVQIKAWALPVEVILVYLAARAGEQGQDRLYHLASLIELFRVYAGVLDWGKAAQVARQYGVEERVRSGLMAGMDICGANWPSPAALQLGEGDISPIHILEWARLGPDAMNHQDAFLKRPYYYALCLLSTKGVRRKLGYFWRSIGGAGSEPVLPTILRDTAAGYARRLQAKHPPAERLAYWIEPGFSIDIPGEGAAE